MPISYEKLPYSEADVVFVTEGDRIGDILSEDDVLYAEDQTYDTDKTDAESSASSTQDQDAIYRAGRLINFVDAEVDKLMDNRGMSYTDAVQEVLQRNGISQEKYEEAHNVFHDVSSAPSPAPPSSPSPARAIIESLRADSIKTALETEGVAAASLLAARYRAYDEIRNPKVG